MKARSSHARAGCIAIGARTTPWPSVAKKIAPAINTVIVTPRDSPGASMVGDIRMLDGAQGRTVTVKLPTLAPRKKSTRSASGAAPSRSTARR